LSGSMRVVPRLSDVLEKNARFIKKARFEGRGGKM